MKHIIWVRYILMVLCVVIILMGWIVRENVDLLLGWMYVMLGLGVACIVVFSLFALSQNPKSAIQSLLGLVAILVVGGVAYAFSSAEPVTTPGAYYDNAASLKVADTGLYMAYALLALAFIAILFGEIRNAFK